MLNTNMILYKYVQWQIYLIWICSIFVRQIWLWVKWSKKANANKDRPGNIWVLKRIFSLLTHLIYPNYRLNKRVTVLISGFVQTESHFELCGSIMNQYLVSSLIALYVSMYLIMTCLVSNTFLRMSPPSGFTLKQFDLVLKLDRLYEWNVYF